MDGALRQTVVLVLAIAQIVLGSSATGAVCLGGARGDTDNSARRDASAWRDAGGCSHAGEGGNGPAPVEPHEDHEDECPCIDVAAPVGRADDARTGWDLAQGCLARALAPAGPWVSAGAASARRAPACISRPPGPEPGLRTTRLLI
jgi:hypothetical protein